MMMSDLRRDYFVTRLADLKAGAAQGIEGVFRETEELARRQFAAEGVAPGKVKMLRYGKFRYQNQEHTTEVLIEEGAITDERLADIEKAFHETYEREYTYRLDAPVEMVGIHLVASAEVGKLKMTKRKDNGAKAEVALKGRRKVDYALEGVKESAIYDGTKLEPGMTFVGPAIVEDPGATVVVHPGNRVEIDGYGNIHIHLAEQG
jgi:N-methylhydantoinase A